MATVLRATVGRLRGDRRGWALLAVASGWLVVLGARFLVPAVLPQVKAAFGVGNAGGGLAVTVIWGTYAPMQSPAGLLADRLGVAPVSNAYVIAVLPASIRGTAWGTLRTGLFLIGATGSTVVGVMADRGLFDESFLLLAAVTVVGGILYAFLPPRSAAGG